MLYNYEDDKELIFAAGTNFRLGCVTFSIVNKFHLVTRDKKNILNKHVILLEALFFFFATKETQHGVSNEWKQENCQDR